MATQYIILSTKQAALQQSRDWWVRILGRPKRPEDVTEFFVPSIDHPTNGTAMLVVDDVSLAKIRPLLTTPERNALESSLKPASDPAVVAFLTAVNTA